MVDAFKEKDGRKRADFPAVFPRYARSSHPNVSTVRTWITIFERDGTWDSRLTVSLPFIMEYCERNNISYQLKAYPKMGYRLERIPPISMTP